MDVAHGLQPIHARHEDIQAQQIEVAVFELGQSLAAIAGDIDAMPSAFQQEPNCQLNSWIIVHYQNFGHENLSTGAESGPTASCKGLPNFVDHRKRYCRLIMSFWFGTRSIFDDCDRIQSKSTALRYTRVHSCQDFAREPGLVHTRRSCTE